MTRTRRSWRPSARSRIVLPSISAANASSGVRVGSAARQRVRGPGGRDLAADDALASVGLEPIDPGRLVRQPLPDRQQQAGDDVDRAVGELRDLGDLRLPGRGEGLAIDFLPMALVHHPQRSMCCSIGRIRRTRRSISPSSSIRLGAGTCTAARPERPLTSSAARGSERWSSASSSVDGRLRPALGDGEQPGFGAGAGMGVDRLAIGDDEALGPQRLQADVIDAAARSRPRPWRSAAARTP